MKVTFFNKVLANTVSPFMKRKNWNWGFVRDIFAARDKDLVKTPAYARDIRVARRTLAAGVGIPLGAYGASKMFQE